MPLITFPNTIKRFVSVGVDYFPVQDVDAMTLGRINAYQVGYGFYLVDLTIQNFGGSQDSRARWDVASLFFDKIVISDNYADVPLCDEFEVDPAPNQTKGYFPMYKTYPSNLANLSISSVAVVSGRNRITLSSVRTADELDEGMYVKAEYNGAPRIMRVHARHSSTVFSFEPDLPIDTSETLDRATTIRVRQKDFQQLQSYRVHRVFPSRYPQRVLQAQEYVA